MWRWIRFCRRPVSLSSSAKILSDSRTCRTSSQAEPSTWAPFQIMAASTTTTAEFSAAIDRMRQRIGTARTSPAMRARPRAARLAGRTAISSCWAVPKANSLHPDLVAAAAALGDQAAHVLQRLDGRIVLALGIGGAKFPRDLALRAPSKTAGQRLLRSAKGGRGCTQKASSLYDDVDGGKKRFNAAQQKARYGDPASAAGIVNCAL